MKVLLSIKPEYVTKILSGEKRFEFRKVGFSNPAVHTVVIYATRPVGKVVGEFEVTRIYQDSPSRIWEKTKAHAGVNKKFFDAYYEGRDSAIAIAVGRVITYERPFDLKELGGPKTPPQSFCYIDSPERQVALELS
ncbi:ASCH domain-containing protein [Pseudomonas sp. EKM23D]|jgi:predicted transcriptional regulator|uniref:ASCH domain-containing protein n=1 Tax=Pseudomonas TaxID=286 RepID=UPI00142D82DE|nr:MULTISPECIES: ASCH domain-containing protein [Pseudomonas]KAF6687869.1 ASCH domain-containing protein [Pseudomonas sp. EKM23D]QKJ71460.1 ASCH domain-containing protein [Pseudomonas rhodesiae]